MSTRHYDIIGDVHGSSEKLERLLLALGYSEGAGGYRHPEHTAVFVGDFIDRGPGQKRVLEVVRGMVMAGGALAVMGNHEFNALAYATEDPLYAGEYCREHSAKNQAQHSAFLTQLDSREQQEYLDWFLTLPLWLDLGEVRVVHACWHAASLHIVEGILGGTRFTSLAQIAEASRKGSALYGAVEMLLKGPEVDLDTYGVAPFYDKDGNARHKARLRWWVSESRVLGEVVEITSDERDGAGGAYPGVPAGLLVREEDLVRSGDGSAIFYGHYWRVWDPLGEGDRWRPSAGREFTAGAVCVDYSAVRGGPLVCYQWCGGTVVGSNFIAVY